MEADLADLSQEERYTIWRQQFLSFDDHQLKSDGLLFAQNALKTQLLQHKETLNPVANSTFALQAHQSVVESEAAAEGSMTEEATKVCSAHGTLPFTFRSCRTIDPNPKPDPNPRNSLKLWERKCWPQ